MKFSQDELACLLYALQITIDHLQARASSSAIIAEMIAEAEALLARISAQIESETL